MQTLILETQTDKKKDKKNKYMYLNQKISIKDTSKIVR